jgi:hypothetical protein
VLLLLLLSLLLLWWWWWLGTFCAAIQAKKQRLEHRRELPDKEFLPERSLSMPFVGHTTGSLERKARPCRRS